VHRVVSTLRRLHPDDSIAVLTFYKGQLLELQKTLPDGLRVEVSSWLDGKCNASLGEASGQPPGVIPAPPRLDCLSLAAKPGRAAFGGVRAFGLRCLRKRHSTAPLLQPASMERGLGHTPLRVPLARLPTPQYGAEPPWGFASERSPRSGGRALGPAKSQNIIMIISISVERTILHRNLYGSVTVPRLHHQPTLLGRY